MIQPQVLITAPVHPFLAERLTALGYQVLYEPAINYETLLQRIGTVEGLVVTLRVKVDKAIINAAPQLKWIGRLGSGMEQIDAAYAESRGIRCISTPEGNSNAVGEHTLGLILSLMNNIVKSDKEVAKGIWLRNENRGVELTGKTVGIVGYGHTGRAFGRLLEPFNVTILSYDKYKDGYGKGLVREAQMEHIQRYADVISFHVPLTDETYHLAGTDFFNGLQQKPYFITTCRGPVTDTAALIVALKEGKIAGAALDVLENENMNALTRVQQEQLDYLTTQPNVILTPHIAGYSFEAYRRMAEILLRKLAL